MRRWLGAALAAGLAVSQAFGAAAPAAPSQLYEARCSHCHQGDVPRAPHLVTFQIMGAEPIYATLTEGTMREHV
ncbi:MAG: hypothetical protein OXH37_01895, partial [Gammaproteobacteria bacterium]|nr:hypothetical protein [Gammaproteobacteria bacterium]